MSEEARAYLEAALALIRDHAYYSSRVDWDTARRDALSTARSAQSPTDTYNAISIVLRRLGDRHSFFRTPEQTAHQSVVSMQDETAPHGERLDGDIGSITLLGSVATGDAGTRYATAIQNVIRRIDQQPVCGWIVDLRGNTGGNMWSVLAGIGPILGEGRVGAFVSPSGDRTPWTYEGGQARAGTLVQASVTGLPYIAGRPEDGRPPTLSVAVLTGPNTASSGEAITIAFRGRPATRSFGRATYGVPTGNGVVPLSDGAALVLTQVIEADRTGRTYDGPIVPDEVVDGDVTPAGDPVRDAALTWLRSQPGCTSH